MNDALSRSRRVRFTEQPEYSCSRPVPSLLYLLLSTIYLKHRAKKNGLAVRCGAVAKVSYSCSVLAGPFSTSAGEGEIFEIPHSEGTPRDVDHAINIDTDTGPQVSLDG